MSEQQPSEGSQATADPWRGIDFSGIIVVLGVGTGRLIELIAEQARDADGNLLVVAASSRTLRTLVPLQAYSSLALVQGQPRRIPVQSETVDLLVVNGVLREVPIRWLAAAFEEYWRVLVPGGRLRISDIIEPTEAEHSQAWAERNRIVRELAESLNRPVAVSVDLQSAARAVRSAGFEDLGISLLPGHMLTDDWLQDTVNAIRNMAGRLVDSDVRDQVLQDGIRRLIEAFEQGNQRAAERFVLQGNKVGDLSLDMEASFTEDDLLTPED